MSPEVVGRISKIAYYPVKGAAGLEVQEATLTKEGLGGDRQFMIVQAAPGANGIHEFITQRNPNEGKAQGFSALALIRPEIQADRLFLTWKGQEPLQIPNIGVGTEIPVRIWDSTCMAVDQGDEVANWLNDHLHTNVRLVKAAGSFERQVSKKWVDNDSNIRFQDGYPIHWFSAASLDELSERAGQEIPWQSFRPNLVVDGLPTQEEHRYHSGEVAGIPFLQPKPCDRCPVTNVDQETGEVTVGKALKPLSTYKSWRKSPREVKVIFGENMLPAGKGNIKVGDEVVLVDLRRPALVYGKRSEI